MSLLDTVHRMWYDASESDLPILQLFTPPFGLQEVKPEVEKESTPSENVYEKDDFFDKLSCEALERLNVGAGGGGQPGQPGKLPPRTRFAEQRKLDIETFGGTGIARRNNFGRGHGRRGGRGVRITFFGALTSVAAGAGICVTPSKVVDAWSWQELHTTALKLCRTWLMTQLHCLISNFPPS